MPLILARSLQRLPSRPNIWAYPAHLIAGRRLGGFRYISVQATPATDSGTVDVNGKSLSASSPDASFEILGSPYSFLSATLSPSQPLYTRRGTLSGLSSTSPDSVISTLSLLSPLLRFPQGIPFLYQRITSTTPTSLLIATPTTHTTLAIVQLDGTTDWAVTQRSSILAWTGRTLTLTPTIPKSLNISSWGNTHLTGRGLLCLSGLGQISSLNLSAGESYIAHPSHVLAYTTSSPAGPIPLPQPYRFKSSQLKLTIPLSLGNWFPESKFLLALKDSNTYKVLANFLLRIRTWSRRTIFGDRLFLRFEGPTTLLVQSRGSRVRDVLTSEQVNEIAGAPAGVVMDTVLDVQSSGSGGRQAGVESKRMGVEGATPSAEPSPAAAPPPQQTRNRNQPKLTVASIGDDGKVTFKATQDAGPAKQ